MSDIYQLPVKTKTAKDIVLGWNDVHLIPRTWGTPNNPKEPISTKYGLDAFSGQCNIGINLGASNWISIDSDSVVARLLAPYILTPTMVIGKDCHEHGSNNVYECRGASTWKHGALSTCENYAELLGKSAVINAPGNFIFADAKKGNPETTVKFWNFEQFQYPEFIHESRARQEYAVLVTACYIYDTWTDHRHSVGPGPWAGFLLKAGLPVEGVKHILKTVSDLHGKAGLFSSPDVRGAFS